jgi:hypothetical protein
MIGSRHPAASDDRNRRATDRRRAPTGSRRSGSGGERSAPIVRQILAGYAERGVFRAYGDRQDDGGRSHFSFRWHTDVPLDVTYAPARRELTFRNLLPAVGSRSAMYRDLKQFLDVRTSGDLPEHRRIDPQKVRTTVTNRAGAVSLIVSLEDAYLEYGVRKAVNLVHELFVHFLRQPMYFHYMVEHFELNPDE